MSKIDNALHLSFFSFLSKKSNKKSFLLSLGFSYMLYNRLAGKSFKSAISNSGFDHYPKKLNVHDYS
jgi:hypothetical protein